MTEKEVLFQISHLVNGDLSFPRAVEQIAILLERERMAKAVIFGTPDPVSVLGSFRNLYRSLYRVELRDRGESLGQVTICFASDSRLPSFEHLADFVGEQLGMLLARTRLEERRSQLESEIARIEEDLATRKVVQRAEGILVAERGMAPAVAQRWIVQQSQKTGLSTQDVAGRIVAYHLETQEQRIA
jgi:GAF domain-containing protein